MKLRNIAIGVLASTSLLSGRAFAQQATTPLTPAERESYYKDIVEKRVGSILKELALDDAAKSTKIHDLLIGQYRALKDRDEAIALKQQGLGKEVIGTDKDPAVQARTKTKTLHDQFLASLSAELTPAQVEKIKDLMTYNKVKVTYDAYGVIVPGLTSQEKARILDLLKQAREEAVDGGSAGEKSAIFQKYKDKINEYLTAQGHDVAKAYEDFSAQQEQAKKQKQESAPKPVPQAR